MFKKLIMVPLIAAMAAIIPLSNLVSFAGGSVIPAPELTGEFQNDMIRLKWTAYDYSIAGWEGYAVFKVTPGNSDNYKKPFALLKFANKNYSYYNLKSMPEGKYHWAISLYDYDVNGISFKHFSNLVTVEVPGVLPPKVPDCVIGHTDFIVKHSANGANAHWSKYCGTFDGYILTIVELDKNNNPINSSKIYLYFDKNTQSTDNLPLIADRRYELQILPYKKTSQGTLQYIEGTESKVIKTNIPQHKIKIHVSTKLGAAKNSIVGYFKTKNSNLIDGYAVYLAPGKKGETPLDQLTPVYLDKDEDTFVFNNLTKGFYTIKVYAYRNVPGGAKVFHQPGSNYETVEVNY